MIPCIYTASHLPINPLDPDPGKIRIEDIAHHLALCNRFAGATKEPISVAQHSVYVSYLCQGMGCSGYDPDMVELDADGQLPEVCPVCKDRLPLQGLLHDGSEAYLGDVTKWLKASPEMASYRAAEARVQAAIYTLFGCALEDAPEVQAADKLMVRYEMLRGLSGDCLVGGLNPEARVDYPPLTHEECTRVCYAYPVEPWTFWSWQKAKRVFLERYDELRATRFEELTGGR